MKDTTFIKAAFVLPLVCSALAWTTLYFLDGAPAELRDIVAMVAVPAFPLISVSYVGFAAFAVALSWRRSVRTHVALGLLSPPAFGGVLILLAAWISHQANSAYARAGLTPEEIGLSEHFVWMGPALIWGYAYVALAVLLRAVCKKVRLIAP